MIKFGQNKEFEGFCPVCGLPLEEGVCRKTHKIRGERQKKYSGKSKSVNKFNDYK